MLTYSFSYGYVTLSVASTFSTFVVPILIANTINIYMHTHICIYMCICCKWSNKEIFIHLNFNSSTKCWTHTAKNLHTDFDQLKYKLHHTQLSHRQQLEAAPSGNRILHCRHSTCNIQNFIGNGTVLNISMSPCVCLAFNYPTAFNLLQRQSWAARALPQRSPHCRSLGSWLADFHWFRCCRNKVSIGNRKGKQKINVLHTYISEEVLPKRKAER